MKHVIFVFLLTCTLLTAFFLFLPRLFSFSPLLFAITSFGILMSCIFLTRKILSKNLTLQIIQFSSVSMCFFFSAIAIFFVEYPFWVTVPAGFCNSMRVKALACQFESEITHTSEEENLPIYIVGHGWHTGLLLRTKDLPQNEFLDFNLPKGAAIEIGWGSESFYRATEYTFKLGFSSFVFPNPSVLHVVSLPKEAEQSFSRSDFYVYWASKAEYRRMLDFVAATFSKGVDGRPIDLGPGIYGDSRFFRANGSYHFPKSCNSWTAYAVYQAGAPIWPNLALSARNTLHQMHLVGDKIRSVDGFKILPN
jgi:uncharacterized protein (TIGR02117 family)